MTIGRLNSAASSVAVPLATSVTSQAASASCEWPSSSATCTPAGVQPAQRLDQRGAGRARPAARSAGPGARGCSRAAAPNRRGAMYWISERRLPGSSATTVSSSARPSARAAGRARHLERDRVGQRVADVGRRRCRASRSIAGSNGKRHSTWSTALPDLLDALAAPGPDRRADEVDRRDAGGLAAAASRSRLKSGASTPMNSSGPLAQQALGQLRCGCRRSRGSGAAPRRSRAPPACRAATRPRSPAPPSAARRCPAPAGRASAPAGRRAAGRRAGRPRPRRRPSRSAARSRPCGHQRAMPRVAPARKSRISATSPAASRRLAGQRRDGRRAPARASGPRGTAAGASA